MVAAIGNGIAFAKGRDYSAWLGLVPRQIRPGTEQSSGASPNAATVTCGCSSCKQPGSFCDGQRTGRRTVSALGSFVPLNAYILTFWLRPSPKLARIAWTVLAHERSYEARVTKAAA